MYVKVHKKGNQWFRDDGTLVGKEISAKSYYYKNLLKIFGKKIFVESALTGNVLIVTQGYFDEAGSFVNSSDEHCGFYAIA